MWIKTYSVEENTKLSSLEKKMNKLIDSFNNSRLKGCLVKLFSSTLLNALSEQEEFEENWIEGRSLSNFWDLMFEMRERGFPREPEVSPDDGNINVQWKNGNGEWIVCDIDQSFNCFDSNSSGPYVTNDGESASVHLSNLFEEYGINRRDEIMVEDITSLDEE